jgi:hypothetical protein
MKERRGRWNPSSQQISLALDCVVARMPLEKAAELLDVKPRSLWIFVRRLGLPIFKAWEVRPRYQKAISSATVGSRTAETPALVSDSHPAPEAAP